MHSSADPISDQQRRIFTAILDNIVWFILVIVLIFFSLFIDNFFQTQIFLNILGQSAFLGILSAGLAIVIISGHLDLSVESNLAFSAILASYLVGTGGVGLGLAMHPLVALAICLVVGGLFGAFNGLLVTKLGLTAFIVTLATFIGIRGLGLILVGGRSIYGLPDTMRAVASTKILGIPLLAVIMTLTVITMHFILTRTRFGRYVYLIGGNPIASFRNGVQVNRIVLLSFVLAGVLAAFAGWLLAARLNGASANIGVGILFDAFAAVVIGGVSLTGGIGRLSGVFAGVLLLTSIDTAINVMGLPPQYLSVIRAALVLFAVILDTFKVRIYKRFL